MAKLLNIDYIPISPFKLPLSQNASDLTHRTKSYHRLQTVSLKNLQDELQMLDSHDKLKQLSKTEKAQVKIDRAKPDFFAEQGAIEERESVDTDRRTSFPRLRDAVLSENPFLEGGG